jgi:NADH-quinone oxidoreductase subunit N
MKTLVYTSFLGIACLVAEVLNLRRFILPLCVLGLAVIFGLNVPDLLQLQSKSLAPVSFYNGMVLVDGFSVAFSSLLIILAILLLLLSGDFYKKEEDKISDYMAITIFTLCGALSLVSFGNMAMFFLGIEVLSISLYVLAGSNKRSVRSNEAGMKYFLMGSFASGLLLFGIALVYGETASFDLNGIADYIANVNGALSPMLYVGVALILVALLFKVSAVPFHFWAPDVYEGSPTLTTAMMATLAKIAAFAAFYRLFATCFIPAMPAFAWTLTAVAAATITLGNLSALVQDSFKRMMAFSGVSHAGYLLIGIMCLYGHTDAAIFYYSLAYGISSLAAFAIAILVAKATGSEKFEAFNGLGKKSPLLAGALTLSMLSLAGIPPFAGFFGKYYIFSEAFRNGHLGITVVAVLNSIVGIYFYFKVILAMYTQDADDKPVQSNLAYSLVIGIAVLISLATGLFPGWFVGLLS